MDKHGNGNDRFAATSPDTVARDTRMAPLEELNPDIDTNGVPQDLQLVADMEPFVSPLTEDNLLYHTNSVSQCFDARHCYIRG